MYFLANTVAATVVKEEQEGLTRYSGRKEMVNDWKKIAKQFFSNPPDHMYGNRVLLCM